MTSVDDDLRARLTAIDAKSVKFQAQLDEAHATRDRLVVTIAELRNGCGDDVEFYTDLLMLTAVTTTTPSAIARRIQARLAVARLEGLLTSVNEASTKAESFLKETQTGVAELLQTL